MIKYICEEKIKTEQQLLGFKKNNSKYFSNLFIFLAAIDYLLSNPIEPIDIKALEESAGIGVVVTLDDIQRVVRDLKS